MTIYKAINIHTSLINTITKSLTNNIMSIYHSIQHYHIIKYIL